MENNLFAPVSVIIPCFNCEDTIDRAVESVYKQTWKPAEVILVDDASMDRSFRKLLKLQEIYGSDWIKVIHSKKNEGPGGARN
ncbi:MAG: glycosyltransferase family 2 protein, partial [Nitrososphaeria archaeon]